MKNTTLSRFYKRLSKKKAHDVAIVAVARKLICLIYHLSDISSSDQPGVLSRGWLQKEKKGSKFILP